MIEIHYMVLVATSSFIVGLITVIWAMRDAIRQEERTTSVLMNDCTVQRSEIRCLREELELTDMYNEHVEGELRKSLDHVELAKLERDELSDDFDELDDLSTAVVNNYRARLAVSETRLHDACSQRDWWARVYVERDDEIELLKLERDEARDDAAALELPRMRSDMAPKRKRLAS